MAGQYYCKGLIMNKEISVLMSVYKNDNPENLVTAVESVINQTLAPKQVVMVVDGPVGEELTKALKELEEKYSIFELVWLEKNVGTGLALKDAWQKCKYEFVAKMDSDDISVPTRFEKEIECFEKDNSLDVVGSNSAEFVGTPDNVSGIKVLPEKHEDIVKLMTSRCPLCHPSMMMKKSIIEKAGGYQHWQYAEDWYLIIRMYLAGAKFYNIQENLVNVRINQATYKRRSGFAHYKTLKQLLKFMRKHKMMGWLKYKKECIKRFVGHVLVPSKWKMKLYRKTMRKSK